MASGANGRKLGEGGDLGTVVGGSEQTVPEILPRTSGHAPRAAHSAPWLLPCASSPALPADITGSRVGPATAFSWTSLAAPVSPPLIHLCKLPHV